MSVAQGWVFRCDKCQKLNVCYSPYKKESIKSAVLAGWQVGRWFCYCPECAKGMQGRNKWRRHPDALRPVRPVRANLLPAGQAAKGVGGVTRYWKEVELKEGVLVQVVGVHPVKWNGPFQPDYGFVEAPEVNDLLAALEAVEWVPRIDVHGEGDGNECAWCGGGEPYQAVGTDGGYYLVGGHAPDCPRQLALAKAKATE